MQVIVDIDIPVRKKGADILPFEVLGVNHSFLVPYDDWSIPGKLRQATRINSRAGYHGKRLNRKFSIGQEQSGIRIWRVK